jgi:tripartite-type tricarboxylate transporter receptor subunit TctC
MPPSTLSRRGALAAVAAGATLPLAPLLPRRAAAAPDRPVRLVLGFPPGTGPDVVARLLAEALRESWPAGVVVDNKPGAAGAIAAQEVARSAAPDGGTLLFGEVGQLAMAPSTYARLPYDPARDFTAIAQVAAADFAFVVPAALPVADLAGYIAWARAQPTLFMGTFGAGTPGHFGAAILAAEAGLRMEPVHFRATGDAMTAALNGQVQGMFGTVALVAPQIRAGKLKALLVTGPSRSALLPEVPTAAELNRPALGFAAWFGLVAPAATPAATLAELEQGVLAALAAPVLQARLAEAGFRPATLGRDAFGRLMREETARWAEVVRATGFRAIE